MAASLDLFIVPASNTQQDRRRNFVGQEQNSAPLEQPGVQGLCIRARTLIPESSPGDRDHRSLSRVAALSESAMKVRWHTLSQPLSEYTEVW